ncbi:signal peptide protein (plasmid) [Rhodococcus erythropolis R138]|nr:signal peptide protein [Rhodococcus erythropolis R138]
MTNDAAHVVDVLRELVGVLGATVPMGEVILHDLGRLPNSIIAISGDLTQRSVGGPATNYLLQKVASGALENEIGYATFLPDGRALRSSTMIVRGASGTPVAALCINVEVSSWARVRAIATAMLGNDDSMPRPVSRLPTEDFPRTVVELADHLMDRAIEDVLPPETKMKKTHRIAVVQILKTRGFFNIKEAVELVADRLNVSRFTIYNYLNEIN